MQLLDHVSVSVKSLPDCTRFYDAIMPALNCEKVYKTEASLGYEIRCTADNESHSCIAVYESSTANTDDARQWCFKAESKAMVESFYRAGIDNGGDCNGAPGLRPHYHKSYYAAFLLDPFGNRLEAVYHGAQEN